MNRGSLFRRDILLRLRRPGVKVSQQQLCDLFGASRMPVRDALRGLLHEGLMASTKVVI
ncbi:GntR family transcriptional regulator [Dactylosporangium fulvum]|uniref:GntR family transcriptional regulator n=1 Tax=Dactylosporangium fulvum TaxID=53359 RepID=UPI003CD099D8